jgi:hypothetical protein
LPTAALILWLQYLIEAGAADAMVPAAALWARGHFSAQERAALAAQYAAAQAGVIPPEEHALIREVRGYGLTEGKRVDDLRPKNRIGFRG